MHLLQDLINGAYLPAAPLADTMQLAGVVSTASHGFSKLSGTISDCIVSLKLVDSAGQLTEYTDSHPHFDAVR